MDAPLKLFGNLALQPFPRWPTEVSHAPELRLDPAFGFLYVNYRREFYYWESVVLVRKMSIVLAPFRERQQQRLESAALVSGILACFAALWTAQMTQQYKETDEDITKSFLWWLSMMVAGVFNSLSLSVFLLMIAIAGRARKSPTFFRKS
eukprot:gene6045-biopygen68587